jgi:RimJ/RimL family protein N-acetyltransferase
MIDARSYTASETLRDGTPVTIRAIHRGDSNRILAAFDRLDRESVYARFFTYKKGLADAELKTLTEVDFDHVIALVVTTRTGDDETLIGGGRYCSEVALLGAQSAELAFITDNDYRGRGLASLILRHLIVIGRNHGLSWFEADVLAQNQAMLAVFKRSGLSMKQRREGNVVHVTLSLGADAHR